MSVNSHKRNKSNDLGESVGHRAELLAVCILGRWTGIDDHSRTMSISESSRWCPSCEDYVLARSVGPNHLVHALVTLFLCGLWLPVWIVVCMVTDDRARCTRCGLATDLLDEPEREPKKRKVRVLAEAEPVEPAAIACPTCGARVEYWPPLMGRSKPCPQCAELVRIPS